MELEKISVDQDGNVIQNNQKAFSKEVLNKRSANMEATKNVKKLKTFNVVVEEKEIANKKSVIPSISKPGENKFAENDDVAQEQNIGSEMSVVQTPEFGTGRKIALGSSIFQRSLPEQKSPVVKKIKKNLQKPLPSKSSNMMSSDKNTITVANYILKNKSQDNVNGEMNVDKTIKGKNTSALINSKIENVDRDNTQDKTRAFEPLSNHDTDSDQNSIDDNDNDKCNLNDTVEADNHKYLVFIPDGM